MENPVFYKTVSAKTVTVGQRYLRNHNKLLWQVEGADGVKTGFTRAAGRILVSSATRHGRRLICVTLNDPNDWADHSALLEEGFSRYSVQQILSAGDRVGTLEVESGRESQVEVLAASDLAYALAPEETTQLAIPGPGFVYAPAVSGADAGCAYILMNGKAIGSVKTVYGQNVEQIKTEERGFLEKLFG
jgi:D-alanyl-D-alanine carboxypeptidase